jgi:hypothetical protein
MSDIRKLKVEMIDIDQVEPYEFNARTHSPAQIDQIVDSIRRFGWTNPVLIDESNRLIAGHGRLEAAHVLGFDKVPAIRIDGLSDDERRALLLADNKISENAGWDYSRLIGELEYLGSVAIEADTLGFSDADILGYHSTIDDTGFTEPSELPQTRSSTDSPTRIESNTEPTQVQQPEILHPGAETAATLVPFSLMLPVDDRERVFEVLNRVRGEDRSMAEALMVVIDAFDADLEGQESGNEQQES